MPAVQEVLRNVRGNILSDPCLEDWGIWDVYGRRVGAVQRFGSPIDKVFFFVMRWIAITDCVWVPFLVSFANVGDLKDVSLNPVTISCDMLANFLYGFGILLQLRTSAIDLQNAREYVDPLSIFAMRATSPVFWMDVLSMLGSFWFYNGCRKFAVLRLFRCWRLPRTVDDVYELHHARFNTEEPLNDLMELFGSIALMIHIFGCAWFAAVTWEMTDVQRTLAAESRWLGGSIPVVYICCISESAGMLAGWGSPAPVSETGQYTLAERVACACLAPASALFTAFVFAQLIEVLSQANALAGRHLERMSQISAEVGSLWVPTALKRRLLRYHTFLSVHNVNGRGKGDDEDLVGSLSRGLQQELKLYLFERLVTEAPFFQEVPSNVVMSMVMCFLEEVFVPGEIVIRQGDKGHELFFVMRGCCEVLSDHFTPVATKEVGDYFGEIALVLDTVRTASIRAKTFCVLANLSRSDFEECLKDAAQVKAEMVKRISRIQETYSLETTPLMSPCDHRTYAPSVYYYDHT